ncbi:AbrB family transcriptional regulator [Halomonas qaidamensis]|uniref:AbrB family transcriptional regulator n=1 Tax=Halomonas qaidamensis TaxID=2866211 RepID=A0ABY6JR01_9GAMM|nr:AbrB family transcriptional regulator [Halomonas qaidamensis]UYV18964.1 AbrB family transcriptional regulator [Halomonas qaidamensis]
MRTVPIFKDDNSQIVYLPADMVYEGVRKLKITQAKEVITLRPVRSSWISYPELPKADAEFLHQRPVIVDAKDRSDLPHSSSSKSSKYPDGNC